jgi:AcrR family transcriptional regulator
VVVPQAPTERGEASRERLLESALTLFSEKGVSSTSVGEICEAAGVARTALYWHFGSKDDLLAAVLERTARTHIEECQKGVYLAGTPEARLDAFMDFMRRLLLDHREVIRLHLAVAFERGAQDPATREALSRVSRTLHQVLSQGLEDALGRRIPNVDMISHTVISLLDGAVCALAVDPERTDVERMLDNMRTTWALLIAHNLQSGEGGGADRAGESG